MSQDFFNSLQMMWQGMVGIFTVIIVILIIVVLLTKISEYFKKRSDRKESNN